MKKIILFVTVLVGFIFGRLFWESPRTAGAQTAPACVSIGEQCRTDNGTREITEYTPYIGTCTIGYHYQNEGNWDQRCHRNAETPHEGNVPPEHVTPTGITCPATYNQTGSGEETICSRIGHEACNTGVIQYDSCEPQGQCPTECGLEASEVPDGQGGTWQCEATVVCEGSPSPKATPTTDVCANIDGIQTGIPEGKHLDASGLNCVEFQLGGAPAPSDSGTSGQVLGASTMAGTGVAEENLFNLIFALGSLLSAFGIRKFATSRVK